MLALANLREHRRSFVAALLAVALGVGLIGVTLLVYDSARPRVPSRFAAAPVLVVPHRAADESGHLRDLIPWSEADAAALAHRLRDGAVIDRSFYAQAFLDGRPVAGDAARDAGHGWASTRLAPYRLVAGAAPQTPGEVAVDASLGVRPGDRLQVDLASGPRRLTVSGTVDGPGFYFTDEAAARLAPGVRAIALLRHDPGTARSAVGAAGTVLTGDARAALEPQFVAHKRFLGTQLITAMAALGLFVTVFVVAATLALATTQRRREIGLLRAVGARPGQIRRMILGEAAGIGLAGSMAGAALAVAAAPLMKAILTGLDVTAPGFTIRVSTWPLAAATLIGVGVAVAGSWAASRQAASVTPLAALLDAPAAKRAMTPARGLAGAGALSLGALLAVLTAVSGADDRINTAIGAAMCLIVAAALLAPVLIGPVVRVVTAPLVRRRASAGPLLIRAELLDAAGRAASTAAPIIAAVGFAVLISGMVQTMRTAYPAGETRKLAGQVLIAPDGTPGLDDQVVAEHPVGKAALPTRVFLDRPGRGPTVIDALGSRDPRWDRPGEAVLGVSTARMFGVAAGRNVTVRFVDGLSETVRISQVLPDDPARGAFVLSRALVRRHDPAALTDTVFIPQADAPRTVAAGAALHDAQSYALADYDTDARLTAGLATMLIVVAVGYSGLAVANSMAMAAYGRRDDFAVMRSAGGTVRQLIGFVAGETALVAAIGITLGVLVTLPPLAGMASGLSQVTGTDVTIHLDAGTVTAAILGSLVTAVGAAVVVTWRVLRPDPGGTAGPR
ncbi:macrolide ABC transporter permease [Actinoplanes sp. SE50]|uniref:ABC transporter permease n=1 Tax=unclassified Actinoplanes TaxID=2626549 RepID=UPI00023ED5F7|nr:MULTISPECIES: ABC transporter permease [unclassified Actinoplanes]AEV84472.1 Macrolide export ATP-binding/permease protein macB [Actinoplanes sp. SE50/110]ATO82864.1 macrolide ABC transporter permease [Actinoplanes sp. SE50]SLM00272.1 macrolide ABC transporter permease [Actinoplanes sp. SE50/110]